MPTLKLCKDHASFTVETGVPEANCTLHATRRVFPEDWEMEVDDIFIKLEAVRMDLEELANKVKSTMGEAEQVIDSA